MWEGRESGGGDAVMRLFDEGFWPFLVFFGGEGGV